MLHACVADIVPTPSAASPSVWPEFGEQWNVSWSQVSRLADLEARKLDDAEAMGGSRTVLLPRQAAAGGASVGAAASGALDDMQLLVGEGFSLQALRPGTWQVWQRQFGSLPLGAFTAGSGTPVDLLARGRAAAQLSAQQQQKRQQAAPMLDAAGGSRVVVQSLNGSLYAIPAWQITLGLAVSSEQCAVRSADAGLVPPTDRPSKRTRLDEPRDQPSTALALPVSMMAGSHGWGEVEGGEDHCESPGGDTCSVKPGIYTVRARGTGSLLLLPPSSNESLGLGSGQQHQKQTGVEAPTPSRSWRLLVLAGAAAGGISAATFVVLVLRRGQAARLEDKQQQQQQQRAAAGRGLAAPAVAGEVKKAPAAGKGSKKRSNGGGSKVASRASPMLSNRMRGAMLQGESEGGSSAGGSGLADKLAAGSAKLDADRKDSLPSGDAVRAGLAAAAAASAAAGILSESATIRQREMKDGVAIIGRMRVGGQGRQWGWVGLGWGGSLPCFEEALCLAQPAAAMLSARCNFLTGGPQDTGLWLWWHDCV